MQYFTFTNALATVAAFAMLTSALVNNGTLEWSDGNVTLYGNATSVISQLKAIDPDWIPRDAPAVALKIGNGHDGTVLNATSFSIESVNSQSTLFCCPVPGQDFQVEDIGDIQACANSLAGLGGFYNIGPNSCVCLVACNHAGIWLCNDNNGPNSVELGVVANYAVTMTVSCPKDWLNRACGQLFDTDNFNVIINEEEND